ncbi:MAG: replication factor C large subunit [Candidatus Brockarchaeota archaeon]|nr:replication factor C large subunit [Candidatus Brockarchaeota archaeon]
MSVPRLSWVEKHKPKTLEEVVGNDAAKKDFIDWLEKWDERGKAALLHGPPGVGKTVLVEVVASKFNYRLIETNASETRRVDFLENVIKPAALNRSLFSSKVLIFFDEIDGLSAEESNAINFLLELIESSKVPIVMAANDPWAPHLYKIRDKAYMIPLHRIRPQTIVKRLRDICKAEGVKCRQEVLLIIAEHSEGDMRAAIEDLELLYSAQEDVNIEDAEKILSYRNVEKNIFEILRGATYASTLEKASLSLSSSEEKPEDLLEWVFENILHLSPKQWLFPALRYVAEADMLLKQISKNSAWRLLPIFYHKLSNAFLAIPQKNKVNFAFPSRIKERFKRIQHLKSLRELESFFLKELHVGKSVFRREIVPFLRFLSEDDNFRTRVLNRLSDTRLRELYNSIILRGEIRRRHT